VRTAAVDEFSILDAKVEQSSSNVAGENERGAM